MFTRARDGRWTFVPMAPDEGGSGGGGEGGENGGADGTAGKTFTQADLDQIVKDRIARERSKYADYDTLKSAATELAELKRAGQTDLERLTGERDTLKGTNTSLTAKNMRLQVALEKGLVGDKAVLADRLSGDTLEDMKKDADELLKLFGGDNGGGSGFDGGARGGQPPAGDMNARIRRAAGRTT